jgi:hypothetical protein
METIPNYDRWQEVERLRGERNAVANKMKGKLDPSVRQALVEEGRVSVFFIFNHLQIQSDIILLFLLIFNYCR